MWLVWYAALNKVGYNSKTYTYIYCIYYISCPSPVQRNLITAISSMPKCRIASLLQFVTVGSSSPIPSAWFLASLSKYDRVCLWENNFLIKCSFEIVSVQLCGTFPCLLYFGRFEMHPTMPPETSASIRSGGWLRDGQSIFARKTPC